MIKIGLLGLLTVFLVLPLKKEKPEYAFFMVLFCGLFIFFYALAQVHVILSFLEELLLRLPIDASYLTPFIKMLGITFLADTISAISKDAGHSSIASQIEVFAKLSIIALSIPPLRYLLGVLDEFMA